jgi:tetratricopeptide (TPR) repeat protein
MAIAYARLNEYQKAESAVNMAEMIFNTTSARRLTSVEYIKMGNDTYQRQQVDSALMLYQEAARLDPNNDEAFYNLGGIYLMKKDIKSARANWQKVLAINPNNVESRNWLTRTENAK